MSSFGLFLLSILLFAVVAIKHEGKFVIPNLIRILLLLHALAFASFGWVQFLDTLS